MPRRQFAPEAGKIPANDVVFLISLLDTYAHRDCHLSKKNSPKLHFKQTSERKLFLLTMNVFKAQIYCQNRYRQGGRRKKEICGTINGT